MNLRQWMLMAWDRVWPIVPDFNSPHQWRVCPECNKTRGTIPNCKRCHGRGVIPWIVTKG